MSEIDTDRRMETRGYTIGYIAALVLTGAAFATVYFRLLSAQTTLVTVLLLGLVQMLVHFHSFLHISLNRSTREDLLLILFSVLVIILMVCGTLVILFNLRARMVAM